ncbi:sugar phosphate isomerase/epimerase [Gaiella sp.]|uniref:sugar phosphate isomerase/epimerase family protein n=1 Tax=Gaiella sp. TaxID=2663207 RepID=UPI003262E8B3
MILSLSEISTVGATFEEDVKAYSAAGFDAIGLWEFKLPEDDDANIALLREYGLGVAVCVPAVPSILQLAIPGMEGPADPGDRIAALCASVSRLAAYDPECIACLTGPLGGRSIEEGFEVVTGGLALVAEAAHSAAVRVGFEPIHVSQRESAGFVHTLADTDLLLATVGSHEIGVLIDTYHVWDDPMVLSWIAANPDRIAGVHVCDWPSRDRTDRVLPGDGISQTGVIIAALAAAGWEGALDVEIFSTPELFWGLPVDEAARAAYAAISALA